MLRQMMADGLIMRGVVDERSITEVSPDDLNDFTQCHFFAGIGGWALALRAAGWPDDRPVWTGSAPCQPFSSAGRQKGKDDERHLFPCWLNLIRERGAPVIFGEQVATAIAHGWLDDVYQGLEAEGYAVGAAVLPACGVGAPHRRDRLWFVAHASQQGQLQCGLRDEGKLREGPCSAQSEGGQQASMHLGYSQNGSMADAESQRGGKGLTDSGGGGSGSGAGKISSTFNHSDSNVDDPQQPRLEGLPWDGGREEGWEESQRPAPTSVFWAGAGVADCPDGKRRLVEPSIPLLAYGVQHRRPILHALGNAIIPQVAEAFIRSFMEIQGADLI